MPDEVLIVETGSPDVPEAPGENLNKPVMIDKAYPNGSNYLYQGKFYSGQVTSLDPVNPENGGKLILDPVVSSLVKIGDFTFNLVPLEIKVDQSVPGHQQYYRGQDFPTASTVEAVERMVQRFCPQVVQINVRGNLVNPTKWNDQVILELVDVNNLSYQISPGEFAFTWMDQGVDAMIYNLHSSLRDAGMIS